MPTATPTTTDPSHHITLSDGTTTIGLIAVDPNGHVTPRAIRKDPIERINLRTSSGDMKYSDFSYPYVPIAQDDWSGGFGQEDFDDITKYSWGYNINTLGRNLLCGPRAEYGTGYRSADSYMRSSDSEMNWYSLYTDTGYHRYLAMKFAASASYSADKAYAWVRKIGTPNGVLTVSLHDDDGGSPAAAVLKSQTLAVATQETFLSALQEFDWTTTTALTSATSYWIKFSGASGDTASNCWQIGGEDATGEDAVKYSDNNTAWTTEDGWGLYYRIVPADDDFTAVFYDYKGCLYCVTRDDDYTAARIFINGDRGAADSNSGDKSYLYDSTKAWTTDEWTDCIVKITAGTGYTDEQNWRIVSSNTATSILCSPDWTTTHDTTTEYVILNSLKWTEQTGHGLTVPVTDVCVSKGVVYYAQGDSVAMRRHREYNNSGTWTASEWAADGTNKATFFAQYYDSVDGWQVWKANSSDANSIASIARATAQTYGTDLTFGTAIPVGDSTEKITGLEMYGEPENLWVLKEGSIWEVSNDIPDAIPLREMSSVASEHNGKAHLVHNVYLYFSLLDRVERYYRSNLDDIGPNIGEGMPKDYRGHIVHMIGYPGAFFAACDGGDNTEDTGIISGGRYSTVLAYNGAGWSCLWRAPRKNTRMRRLHLQVIPGVTADRLWVSMGSDLMMLHVDLDPTKAEDYHFTDEAVLESSWNYANLKDIYKYYKSYKVFSEELSADPNAVVYMHYKKDADSTWTAVGQTEGTTNLFDASPVEEHDIGTTTTHVYGRRIKYRITIRNPDSDDLKVKSVVLESVPIVPPKYAYSITFMARDEGVDLQGDDDTVTSIETLVDQLDTWAAGGEPVTMRCIFEPMDNKVVFVQPYGLQPVSIVTDEGIEVQVATIALIQA